MTPLKYRLAYLAVLGLLAVGEAADAIYSIVFNSGPPIFALIDVFLVLVVAFGVALIIRMALKDLRNSKTRLALAHQSLRDFRKRHSELLGDMWIAVGRQFTAWKLSPMEKAVAEHFIRGYSTKQIAAILGKRDRTVRNQAFAVYQKSGMRGRSDLSAYFLRQIFGANENAESQNGTAEP